MMRKRYKGIPPVRPMLLSAAMSHAIPGPESEGLEEAKTISQVQLYELGSVGRGLCAKNATGREKGEGEGVRFFDCSMIAFLSSAGDVMSYVQKTLRQFVAARRSRPTPRLR